MTRHLIYLVERLPLGTVTRRALIEALADHQLERRGGLVAGLRIMIAAVGARIADSGPLRFFGNDLRTSMRRLKRSPAYLLFSVATLAVVIGSTTAVYSVVDAAIYRQQPIPHIEQVMNIYQSDMRAGASGPLISLSPHDFEDLDASQTVFSSMAAWSRFSATVVTNGASESLLGEMVSGTYFSLLGVNAALGRTLQPADAIDGAPMVMVLSDGLWRRLFGADPTVVGRTVRLQGTPVEIVGVAPAWFRGSDIPNLVPTPAWIPLRAGAAIRPDVRSNETISRDARRLMLKGRLRPGVTLEAARAEVTAISQRIATADPDRRSQRDPALASGLPPAGWFVLPMADLRLHESVHVAVGPAATALMIAVVLVLLVGCSNLANLGLARAARRRQEIAVRIALGAPRSRILREQLVESTLVAATGWALGLPVALALMRVLGSSVEMHAAVTLTLQLVPTLNLSVLMVSVAATAVAVAAVGLGPAIRQTRSNLREAVTADGAAVSPRWRARGVLVAGQVAASVLLLAIATLCLKELRVSLQHDPGFALDKLAVLQLDFSANQYDHARVRQELDAVGAIVNRTSGAASVALMTALPVGSGGRPATATISTSEDMRAINGRYPTSVRWMAVSGPVFDTLGMRVVEGRPLADADAATAEPVVVVSKSLADEVYPHGAVGRPLSVKRSYFQPEASAVLATIVGVVSDTDIDVFGASSRRRYAVYLPLAQTDEMFVSVVARADGRPERLLGPMRAAIRDVDREVAVVAADTGLAMGGPAMIALQVAGGIAGSLGGFALLLAIAGLYGVLADVVARRTREIGIRVALGAARATIHRMVLVDGLRPVIVGAVVGLGLAYFTFTVLPMFVFLRQLRSAETGSMALATIPLLIAALVASYIPARRAARVDPNVALREL